MVLASAYLPSSLETHSLPLPFVESCPVVVEDPQPFPFVVSPA